MSNRFALEKLPENARLKIFWLLLPEYHVIQPSDITMWPTTSLLRLLVPFPPSPERLARSFYQVGIFDFSLILTRDGPPDGIPAARLFFRRIGIGNAERIRHLQIGVTLEQLEDFDRAILPFVCEIPPKRSPFGIPLVLQQPQLFGNGSTGQDKSATSGNARKATQSRLHFSSSKRAPVPHPELRY
ncbi:hypothetical protein AOQ84DRAFT_227316 [Glonium stellatum]|uniref:Uncharacterized protein n=1 Tax=Glonium stellatum TaxID=574774 RepID=A0A8E2F966_9PEZI|nr:hypothetical protein AOQ84DRAFT_227316 [Glonium stellatum]